MDRLLVVDAVEEDTTKVGFQSRRFIGASFLDVAICSIFMRIHACPHHVQLEDGLTALHLAVIRGRRPSWASASGSGESA